MVKKAIVIAAVIAAVVLAVFYYNIHTARTAASGSIDAYNELARSYNEKIEKYNAAASSIAAANEELQGVLNEAGSLADQNKKAYDPRTLEKLQKAINEAGEEIISQIAETFDISEEEILSDVEETGDKAFFYHEYRMHEMHEAYAPFLGWIRECYEKFYKADMTAEEFLEECHVYRLHIEPLSYFIKKGICTRSEDVLHFEIAFETERMLQDLISAAVNECMKKVDEMMTSEMSKLTSGLGLPPGII